MFCGVRGRRWQKCRGQGTFGICGREHLEFKADVWRNVLHSGHNVAPSYLWANICNTPLNYWLMSQVWKSPNHTEIHSFEWVYFSAADHYRLRINGACVFPIEQCWVYALLPRASHPPINKLLYHNISQRVVMNRQCTWPRWFEKSLSWLNQTNRSSSISLKGLITSFIFDEPGHAWDQVAQL